VLVGLWCLLGRVAGSLNFFLGYGVDEFFF